MTARQGEDRDVVLVCDRCHITVTAEATVVNGQAHIRGAALPRADAVRDAVIEDARRAWLAAEQRGTIPEAQSLRADFRRLQAQRPNAKSTEHRTHARCGGMLRVFDTRVTRHTP
jgi:hypothetical protein